MYNDKSKYYIFIINSEDNSLLNEIIVIVDISKK